MRDARVCVRSSKQKGETLEIREPILIVRTYFIYWTSCAVLTCIQDCTYCGWFFAMPVHRRCNMLCYHRRYVYEYAAVRQKKLAAIRERVRSSIYDKQVAATYCINERTNRHVHTLSVVFKNA